MIDERTINWSEAKLQSEIWKWINNNFIIHDKCVAYHIPNGGARNEREGANLKAQGVVPGVADLHILCNGKSLYIELKTAIGTQSNEQKEFERMVNNHGAQYHVVRDEITAKNIIINFIKSCE